MRVLIVDDEPLARTALANVVRSRHDVDFFDSAADAIEALEKLQTKLYDIILLDIRMPELSGIELVDRLKYCGNAMPAIIFVTAHDEHAVIAFEKHAMDYVLKPFSSERVHEALDVAIHRTASERAARLLELLPQLRSVDGKSLKIAIKTKGRIIFLDPAEVTAVEAQGNYVLLQRRSGSYLLRESITAMEGKLRVYGFLRIHRSVLVNAGCVQEIQPLSTGEYLLRLRDGKEYTVSRTYKTNLKAIAPSWMSAGSDFAR